jgi:hypothetical protein
MIGENDRVRQNTPEEVNVQLDRDMADRVREYSGRTFNDLSFRIEELENEWDIERVLETNASVLAFAGLGLGMAHNRKWLAIPAVVLPFLFQHAVQGWCPPVPLFRRMGYRTREEIDREKYALKYLRGDFETDKDVPATAALKAVSI